MDTQDDLEKGARYENDFLDKDITSTQVQDRTLEEALYLAFLLEAAVATQ